MRWHMRRMILNPIDYEPDCRLLDTHQCKLGYISTHQYTIAHNSGPMRGICHMRTGICHMRRYVAQHLIFAAGAYAAYVICGCHMRHICRHMSYAPRVVAEPKSC